MNGYGSGQVFVDFVAQALNATALPPVPKKTSQVIPALQSVSESQEEHSFPFFSLVHATKLNMVITKAAVNKDGQNSFLILFILDVLN